LLEDLLDWFMLSERQIYLLKNENDKGNGFYDRKLGTPMGNLDISVPRTRTGDFRPHILPEPYKRVDESYTDLLMSLVVNGYSELVKPPPLLAMGRANSTAPPKLPRRSFSQ